MGELYNSCAMKEASPQVQRQRHIHKEPVLAYLIHLSDARPHRS